MKEEGAQTVPVAASITFIKDTLILKGRLVHAWASLCGECVIPRVLHRAVRSVVTASAVTAFASASHDLTQL